MMAQWEDTTTFSMGKKQDRWPSDESSDVSSSLKQWNFILFIQFSTFHKIPVYTPPSLLSLLLNYIVWQLKDLLSKIKDKLLSKIKKKSFVK